MLIFLSILCRYVDKDGQFSGEDVAFIYPDFTNVLRGRFDQERVEEGRMCLLLGCRFERGMAVPRFSTPVSEATYSFEAASKTSIGKNPTQPDPWEAEKVEVRPSELPQGGEGLFAKRDIKVSRYYADDILAFVLLPIRPSSRLSAPRAVKPFQRRPPPNLHLGFHERSPLGLPDQAERRHRPGHPARMHRPGQILRHAGTQGWHFPPCPKIVSHNKGFFQANHSNLPNAEWALVEPPRFGLIRGLRAQEDIVEGREVLVNYHINLADAPRWYRQVWLGHQRKHKGMSDQGVARLLARWALQFVHW